MDSKDIINLFKEHDVRVITHKGKTFYHVEDVAEKICESLNVIIFRNKLKGKYKINKKWYVRMDVAINRIAHARSSVAKKIYVDYSDLTDNKSKAKKINKKNDDNSDTDVKKKTNDKLSNKNDSDDDESSNDDIKYKKTKYTKKQTKKIDNDNDDSNDDSDDDSNDNSNDDSDDDDIKSKKTKHTKKQTKKNNGDMSRDDDNKSEIKNNTIIDLYNNIYRYDGEQVSVQDCK
jgi:hypothetical protein